MTRSIISNSLPLFLALALCASLAEPACAQLLMDDLPAQAKSIDVENRVGQFIPLDLTFSDERGQRVGLDKYFKQGKPIVMTLNYSDCPGLCVAQLDMLVGTLRELEGAQLGEEFEILTVSIDPRETPEKAARTKAKYTDMIVGDGTRKEDARKGWHFLTGKQSDIIKLADAAGFRYSYDKDNDRYNHAAATYFLSADGRICRYLLSLGVEPKQFQLAVAEAAEGKLTRSFAETIMQMCYMYDPEANRYTASARRILALTAGAFVVLLTAAVAPFWFAGRIRSAQADASGIDSASGAAAGNQTPQAPVAEVSSTTNVPVADANPSRQSLLDPYNSSPSDVSSDSPQAVK